MIDPDLIPESDLESPESEGSHADFPAELESHCRDNGLDPSAVLPGAIEYSPELEAAIKARAAIREHLDAKK